MFRFLFRKNIVKKKKKKKKKTKIKNKKTTIELNGTLETGSILTNGVLSWQHCWLVGLDYVGCFLPWDPKTQA